MEGGEKIMAIIRWRPSPWVWRFPSLLEDEDWPELMSGEGLDVYETDKEVVVKAAVPGIPKDKIDITFEDGVLRIRGMEEETEEEKKKKKVVYRSRRATAFDYCTTLPRAVNPAKMEANMEDGVLVIKAPIAKEAKPKKITIKAKAKK